MGGSREPRRVSTLTKGQQQLLDQVLGGAGGVLPGGLEAIMGQLDPERAREIFQQSVAAPAQREFQSQVIPSILQSAGGLGAKGGTSLERQLARAGQRLEQGLGEQFAGFQAQQQQAGIQNLMQLLFPAIGQQAFALQQRQPSFGQQLLGGAFGLAGQLGGAALGRPPRL
jgi:hypothetical protein